MSKRKPENIPPVPDMIIEALRDAQQKGAPGLTPSGLLSYIKQRYSVLTLAVRTWARQRGACGRTGG